MEKYKSFTKKLDSLGILAPVLNNLDIKSLACVDDIDGWMSKVISGEITNKYDILSTLENIISLGIEKRKKLVQSSSIHTIIPLIPICTQRVIFADIDNIHATKFNPSLFNDKDVILLHHIQSVDIDIRIKNMKLHVFDIVTCLSLKDSTDMKISIFWYTLDHILHKDIEFYILTGDKFAQHLIDNIKDRKCTWCKTWDIYQGDKYLK